MNDSDSAHTNGTVPIERYDWSVNIGRWFGVSVRAHILLFLAVLVVFALEWQHSNRTPSVAGTGLIYALVIFFSVLLHELAHFVAAMNLGGTVESIVLVPWGGLSEFKLAARSRGQFVVFAAGIFANLCVYGIGMFLLVQTGKAETFELINPLQPPTFYLMEWEVTIVQMITWVNIQLVFLNLLPCFPFDLANMLRTLFGSVNSELGELKIESTIKALGQLTGAVLVGIAILMRSQTGGPIEPSWALLLGMGIIVFFCARYDFRNRLRHLYEVDEWQDEEDMEFQSDLIYGDSGLNFLADEGYSQWLVEKRQERERSRMEVETELERDEEHEADQILSKLHTGGLQSLSPEERRLLERVSARIRLRRQLGQVD